MTKSRQRQRQQTKGQKEHPRTSSASTVSDFEKLAKKDTEKKAHKEKQSEGQQNVPRPSDGKNWEPVFVIILVAVIGLIPALIGFPWSSQPALSLWGTVVPLSLLILVTYYVLTRMVWKANHSRIRRICLTAVSVIFLIGFCGQAWISTRPAPAMEAKELRGFLAPANEPNPPPPPACPDVPPSATSLYFGDSLSYLDNWNGEETPVIRIANEKVLTFERVPSGAIVLNATLRDMSGNTVATINKNVFRARSDSGYEAKSDDPHTVLVLDKYDRVVLYVRFLNPRAIKILGIFGAKGRLPVVINESGITRGRGPTLNGNCHRNSLGIVFE